jgi:hypothetical protein
MFELINRTLLQCGSSTLQLRVVRVSACWIMIGGGGSLCDDCIYCALLSVHIAGCDFVGNG